MRNSKKFNPEDLDKDILNEALQPLSDYYISKRRLRIREKKLGAGGFGIVKLADLFPKTWLPFGSTSTTVAVKELRTDNDDGVPLRNAVRLAREIKVWASCKHDNLLEFTGYYLSKDFKTAYLVSPYMANGNIKDYLSRESPSRMRRLELVLDTIKGLAYLHSSTPPIVHGDLKSLNVLVTNAGKALLCDLGLAKAMEDEPTGLSTSNGFKGTIRYTSPEVLNGSPRDCPSDIWAWGCLALEIITGNPPYHTCQKETQLLLLICGHQDHRRAPAPSDISSQPSIALDLLRMCWSFEPGRRPDARQCVDEIETTYWLLSSSLPKHLSISLAGLDFTLPPKDQGSLGDGISVARLSLQGKNEVVTVKSWAIFTTPVLQSMADELNRLWALKHENLLELIGYSMSRASGTFFVISPYTHQTILLHYLLRYRHLTRGARLNMLRDMLKGLVYLHSSAIKVVHGALNPWTVVINGEGKAVLPLVGTSIQSGLMMLAGSPGPPTRLWRDTSNARPDRPISSKSDIWSWACIVLQVMCEIRQVDGVSIHSSRFLRDTGWARTPEPVPTPILPDRLLGLVRSCWNAVSEERPSASDCLEVLDLVIQEI